MAPDRTWAAICALTLACDRQALDYLLTKPRRHPAAGNPRVTPQGETS